jgi:hypothetical protein
MKIWLTFLKKYFAESDYKDQIEFIIGDAKEEIKNWIKFGI